MRSCATGTTSFGLATGSPIRAIMEAALAEGRVLVTLDKDFGALAVVFGQPHCGIVRLVDIEPSAQAAACRDVMQRHGAELRVGAIASVTKDRIRLRPPQQAAEPPGTESDDQASGVRAGSPGNEA